MPKEILNRNLNPTRTLDLAGETMQFVDQELAGVVEQNIADPGNASATFAGDNSSRDQCVLLVYSLQKLILIGRNWF